mmetsp:Transcript_6528/g.7399  ORF Transcript_6528/g.7399 Transcript_6528/m.7399 type:complete len:327 (+) Transcript_6528:49-1029(+)
MFEQESSQPGKLSIISGPLDALEPPITGKEAYDETLALLRYPLDSITEALKKDLQVTELDANSFMLKLILDGKKLDNFGYGKGDGTDRLRYWKKVVANPAKLSIFVTDYVPEITLGTWVDEAKEELVSTCEINFLQDPPQMEYCIDDHEGNRLAGPEVRDGMYGWSDRVVENIHSFKNAKVKVTPDAASIKEKGLKSMVSEPMDEHVSYENFFPQLVNFTRNFLSQIPNINLEESDGEIRGSLTNDAGEVTRHLVKFNQDAGTMTISVSHQDIVRTEMHRVVHQAPLVLEAWDVDAEKHRHTGAAKAKEIQRNVNIMIDKANSWFG